MLKNKNYPHTTSDPAVINEISQTIYKFCYGAFKESIEKVYSRHLTEFLLDVYSKWSEVLQKLKAGKLLKQESKRYLNLGPSARLAIQYCLEKIVELGPSESPDVPEDEQLYWLDRMIIAAEIMVLASGQSSTSFTIFPNKSTLKLSLDAKLNEDYMEFILDDSIKTRLDQHNYIRAFHFPEDYSRFYAPAPANQIIGHYNPIFEKIKGITLSQMVNCIIMASKSSKSNEGFESFFILEYELYKAIAHNTELDIEIVKWVFSGMVLTKELFENEQREIWRPRQSNRSLRRPFLRLPHPSGLHLCWQESMVQESILYVIQELCFRRVPFEWNEVALSKQIDQVSFKFDSEWETIVFDELKKRGLIGEKSIKKINKLDGSHINIGNSPGEIDCLMCDPRDNSIFLIEIKRTQPSYNPTQYRDEISKYVLDEKSYIAKLNTKMDWVKENIHLVLEHLIMKGYLDSVPEDLPTINVVLVTKYECFAKVLDDLPIEIISLTELLYQYDENQVWRVTKI